MRKTLLYTVILTVLSLFTGYGKAHAESPYLCDFNTAISTSAHDFKVSVGWGHVVSSYTDYDDYETYYATYTYRADKGIDNSGALEAGSQTSYGSGWSQSSTTDLLVTPKLNGASSIYVKKTTYSGTVKFYKVTKNGSSYTRGSQISVTLPTLSTDEFVKVDIPEQTDAYVGIYASSVILDNFEATDADTTPAKGLTIQSVTNNSGYTINCDEDNNFTINATATIVNTGDVDLNPGDEGYSLSIVNYSRGNAVIGTTPITEPLAVGATTTVTLTGTAAYADYPDRNRYDVMENITQTSKMIAWIELKPYLPVIELRDAANTRIDAGAAIDYGRTTEAVTKVFTIKNTGAAPLNLTAIELPAGFSTDAVLPLNVAAGESADVNIKLDATTPGIYNGAMTLKGKNADDFSVILNGIVIDESKYYVTFEDQKIPTGAIAEMNWKIEDHGTSIPGNRYSLSHGSRGDNAETKFITPLLRVTEGEKMTVDVARTNYNTSSSDVFLNVYYSADRKNWTKVKEIAATELSGTRIDYNKYISKFTTFTIEGVPAGDYYIGFGAQYTTIDNIYGFEKVDVANDWLITAAEVPTVGMVNNAYTAKVSVKNNNDKTVEAGSYTATLYVGMQAIACETVPEIAIGASQEFVFNFTPHAAGTENACIIMKDNNSAYSVSTDIVELAIAEEAATNIVQVGEAAKTSGNTPLCLNYKKSESQSVYTAAQLGLNAGDRIGSLTWKGYSTSADHTTNVKVYLANVDAETITAAEAFDISTMTCVYDGSYTFKVEGSSSSTTDHLSVSIAEPFVYDGRNLCIVVKSEADAYKQNYFEVANASDQCIYRRTDNGVLNEQTYTAASEIPVIYLGVVSDPIVISGKVACADKAIEGANVSMTSGDVLYTARTDAEGAYSLSVIQTDKTYTFTVAATGYETVTEENVTPAATDAKNVNMKKLVSVVSGKVTCGEAAVEGATVTLTSGETVYTATTNAEGAYTIDVTENEKTYTMAVAAEGYRPYSEADITAPYDIEKNVAIQLLPVVSGKVTCGEAAVEGATVTLTSGEVVKTATTDAEGAYKIDGMDMTLTYTLAVAAEGYRPYSEADITVTDDLVKNIAIQLLPVVSGKVTCGEAAVEGATVTLTAGEVAKTATTDAEGAYKIDGIDMTLTYTLAVAAEGYRPYSEADITVTDDLVKNIAIQLLPVVSGKVTCGEAAVEGATVTLTAGEVVNTATTDAEGAYKIDGVDMTLTYTLTVAAEGYRPYSEADITVTDDLVKNIAIQLLPVVSGKVTCDGAAVEGATVTLTAGEVVKTATTDAEGAYKIDGVDMTLTYTMTVTAKDCLPYTEENITVTDDLVKDVVLTVDPASGINGVAGATLDEDAPMYNMQGVRVDKAYRGIVIQHGKKFNRK